jgi:hypothetical protein
MPKKTKGRREVMPMNSKGVKILSYVQYRYKQVQTQTINNLMDYILHIECIKFVYSTF